MSMYDSQHARTEHVPLQRKATMMVIRRRAWPVQVRYEAHEHCEESRKEGPSATVKVKLFNKLRDCEISISGLISDK